MQWKIINGWYCITVSGLMSWKFKSLRDGIEWAFVTREACNAANEIGEVK